MIRLVYNLVWPLVLLLFLPGYLLKMFRRGGYREKFGQRLGIYGADVRSRLAGVTSTWFHAVSVGEVAIALKLANELRKLEPNLRCALTVTTTTGFAFAMKSAARWIEVIYSPLDFWPVMRRAFSVIQPQRIILVEAEVWPNLVAEARQRKIPIALVNARLSVKSEKRFRRFRAFVAPIFRLLDLICIQEEADADRWEELGVSHSKIRHCGSIKSDPEIAHVNPAHSLSLLRDIGISATRPILLGGSTHPGEEKMLAHAFLKARQTFADLFLIVAPRHAERVYFVRAAVEQAGLRVAMQSAEKGLTGMVDCLIIDTTGELQNWYPLASVVFIGKSLLAHGGQNPVEAIIAGKPVIFGPHMENFSVLARALVAEHGAVEIQSADELAPKVVELLRDPELGKRCVANARKVLQPHRGATARTAAMISALRPAEN